MSELHWTGAAVLLALAVLGSGSSLPRRSTRVSRADFAREDDLAAVPRPAPDVPPRLAAVSVRAERRRAARRRRCNRELWTCAG
jgi:hypothetical protein